MKIFGVAMRSICILLAAMMLTGCLQDFFVSGQSEPEEYVPQEEAAPPARRPPGRPNPNTAIQEIYAHFEGNISESMYRERFKEVVGITSLPADRLHARISNPRGGLTDVVIIRPQTSATSDVREILYRYRDRRIAEFENFDILGSLEIARSAIVFEHGEYLILLMTADNDEAQIIINRYMPL